MNNYFIVVIACLSLLSCTENKPQPDVSDDPFIAKITGEMQEAAVIENTVIKTPTVNRVGDVLRWGDDRVIVEDRSQLTLKLLRMDGSEVASAGGRGRGPGEFELINQLHKGSDGYLYVLDRNLTRVSKFQVTDDEIDYVTSYSPDVPDQMFLVNIFVTPSGNVNLLNYFENFMAGENSYRLHRSDSTFNTGEQLFEFEGTEKYESDNGLYMDHPLARQTLWSQDGNYFYMLNSHQSEWQKRNLMTDTIDTVAYTHQTDRNNSARSKAYLAGRLEPVIGVEPDVKELIDESDDLPLNHNMFASEDWIVIPTFYAGGSEKIVVLYNQTSKETAYCSVPAHFFPVAFDGDELIGKNSGSEGEIRLEILEVELPG